MADSYIVCVSDWSVHYEPRVLSRHATFDAALAEYDAVQRTRIGRGELQIHNEDNYDVDNADGLQPGERDEIEEVDYRISRTAGDRYLEECDRRFEDEHR